MGKPNITQTMNFFQHQEKARRRTGLLIFLFVCAVFAIFLAIHTLVANIALMGNNKETLMSFWLNPKLLFYDFGAVFLVVGGGSLFKILSLSTMQGDGIAEQLGGRRLSPGTGVLRERRLLNIVEEMAIASGIHVPNVYLLENEDSINAFAAGFTPNTSVVAVTNGALNYLTRDELQGVIAHEFSHILNGDTRINLRLIGVLFGLEMIVILGMVICRNLFFINISRSEEGSDSKGGGMILLLAIFLFGLALVIIGSVGVFFSNLIRAAVSRQREFLADASAVQFTRNPKGIGGALAKIGCPNIGSRIENSKAVESCHLFIGSVFTRGFFSSLLDSHPDLAERIHRIDPSFNGVFPIQVLPVDQGTGLEDVSQAFTYSLSQNSASPMMQNQADGQVQSNGDISGAVPGSMQESGSTGSSDIPPEESNSAPFPSSSTDTSSAPDSKESAEEITQSIGAMRKNQLDIAESLLENIPENVRSITRELVTARFAIYSLLMVDYLQAPARTRFDEAVWTKPVLKKQWNFLCSRLNVNEQNLFRTIIQTVKEVSISSRISVVELAIPILKTMEKEEYRQFRNNAIELIKADNSVDLFEYTLQHYLIRDLDVYYRLSAPAQVKYTRFEAVSEYFRQTLSYLAYEGNDDLKEVYAAFNAAVASLGANNLTIVPQESCSPAAFGRALNELAFSSPSLKQVFITGFYHCVVNDGKITDKEGDLMRAISAALDLPMPHWGTPV